MIHEQQHHLLVHLNLYFQYMVCFKLYLGLREARPKYMREFHKHHVINNLKTYVIFIRIITIGFSY